jgi:hypothetical protein
MLFIICKGNERIPAYDRLPIPEVYIISYTLFSSGIDSREPIGPEGGPGTGRDIISSLMTPLWCLEHRINYKADRLRFSVYVKKPEAAVCNPHPCVVAGYF